MKFQILLPVATPGAEERFFQICSFNLAEAGQRNMEKAAFAVQEHLLNQMHIRAAVRFWDQPVIDGDKLQLDDAILSCGALGQIPKDAIKGVFVYLLTIGETDIEAEDNIMTELYHDIWGTAYVESAMEVLRRDCLQPLIEGRECYLSESFGPGYFGMAMEEGKKLFDLLREVSIGVTQKSSGLLTPEKSCLGLMFLYDRADVAMPQACEKCLGTRGGCMFCEKRSVKELE